MAMSNKYHGHDCCYANAVSQPPIAGHASHVGIYQSTEALALIMVLRSAPATATPIYYLSIASCTAKMTTNEASVK